MRISATIDPIDRDVALLLDETLGADAVAEILRQEAAQALLEAQDQNQRALGYVPEHVTFVDGAPAQGLAGIRPGSTVTFEFQLLTDVIEWVHLQLVTHSPVGPGPKEPGNRYSEQHVWFADDIEMDPMNPPPAEQYMVLNAQPYARRIERGWSNQAPGGVYEAVAGMAKARFGNIAYIGFGWRSFNEGGIGRWAATGSARRMAREIRGGNPRTHTDWLTRQPAIIIDPGK